MPGRRSEQQAFGAAQLLECGDSSPLFVERSKPHLTRDSSIRYRIATKARKIEDTKEDGPEINSALTGPHVVLSPFFVFLFFRDEFIMPSDVSVQ
jgi:hypothetical protein